ncbi:MAG: glycoside hydrolase protein, partial [Elusimicrobia bacterium]
MRYVCVHGHFYQPPRENPWMDRVRREPSAAPYHDWNERITAECYGPNAHARILDSTGRITKIMSTYSRMSFNMGPTLLSWLEAQAPATYAAIVASDAESAARFGGHGSAMAQAYNHVILPLADERDRRTQVAWGVADFRHRFGRRPEGMWLPETAVDVPSLEALAEAGIAFTVLAPRQAARVRPPGGAWKDVRDSSVDPTRSYKVSLPSGRSIAVFFYDGPVSQAVAFEGLLTRGEHLAGRLCAAFPPEAPDGALAHVATDGESYGHHHRFGEMALAWALDRLAGSKEIRLTNYAQHLALFPPAWEAEVVEPSSWSCAHGVERWRSDCGCHTGGRAGWTQAWRAPLRGALDRLRDGARQVFEDKARGLFKDPWAARDAYIGVVLRRSKETTDAFLAAHAARPLSGQDEVVALRLMELQRHAMLMYTSCGWFFNDLSGLETVQVLRYAARTHELALEVGGPDLSGPFLAKLREARSNVDGEGDGAAIYERRARSAHADVLSAAARHGSRSLSRESAKSTRYGLWELTQEDARRLRRGEARLSVGLLSIASAQTRAATQIAYCYVLDGGPLPRGAAGLFKGMKAYEAMSWETTNLFSQGDTEALRRALDKHFPEGPDVRRQLDEEDELHAAEGLLEGAAAESEAALSALYERQAPLLRALARRGIRAPRALCTAAEFALNGKVARLLQADSPDLPAVEAVLDELKAEAVRLDEDALAYGLGRLLRRLAEDVLKSPDDPRAAAALAEAAALAHRRTPGADLWTAQNDVYAAVTRLRPARHARALRGDEAAASWCRSLEAAAQHLNIKV